MTRLRLLLALYLPALFTLALLHSPAEVLAAVTAVALVVLLLTAAPVVEAPAWVRSLSLREKALKTAFLRLRDPDAAGRPRPRAPGLGLSA
ncbi:putative lysophospholipase L1 biosynthesis ABC-type transport system permease subunit [Saccharothrix tamanrassetensis]|uniref:Putative lysophospholipase L1 biosynthesis ABC-type transport system permease subunit n=1 Tax=Saccharothrix tamanrassetensis TaxID=1051531 RepID=A0A841CNB9_9PSEU|nr:DUF6412 domain-containing protein [Saccharothrix tamanrassetensis]MBB5957628.1 putative lysophospholipase L1 biosynthesis ABC-type transport system permease subunit [Saccharothrix tamanrassetensis]